MLYGIALPPYGLIKKFEGQGNWAIGKYYRFPYNLFYVMKFRMIIDLLTPGKIYRNILDFGGGPAEIFKKELGKHAMNVKSYDLGFIDSRWKFDVIVCASVLEFLHLSYILPVLQKAIAPKGFMIVASPMQNWVSRLYFKLIGDKNIRLGHQAIMEELKKHFEIKEYKTWLGLYFACKVTPK